MSTTDAPSTATVLDDIRSMLITLLDEYGLDDVEITRETTFHDDLGLESIDFVTVGAMLAERYGERVNLAAFFADMELDEVIALRVGRLVDYVVSALSGEQALEI